jgi:beta-glucanase (GH16 family)
VPKPVLDPLYVKYGTKRDVVNKIQAYLLTNMQATSYDVKRIPQFKGSSNKTLRGPVTAYEKQLVTYVQHQADFLMAKLWSLKDKLMPGQKALIQNIKNTWGGKRYVTIDASAGIYGTTSKADDGQLILGLSPKIRLAFALNTMCHELAHMGTIYESETHTQNHTISWRWLVQFGCRELQWPFVEFDWRNACTNFNICNVKDFDSTRVYSLAPMGSNKFKGWGKPEVNHRSNVVADKVPVKTVYKSGGKRQTVVPALWRKLVLSRRRGPPKIIGQLQRATVLAGLKRPMRLRADPSDPYLDTDFYKAIESMGAPVYEDKFEDGTLSTSWKLAIESLGGGTHEKQVFDPKMVTVTTSQLTAMDIRMEKSPYLGYPYYSGKAVLNVVAKTGAVKFLAMLPSAPGLMPRLQLFPVVNGKYFALEPKGYPNWPSAGQIGVAETRGDEIDNVHQTLFASSGLPGSVVKKSVDLVTKTSDGTSNFATNITAYGATFDETGVKFYIKDAFVKEYKWGVDTDINPYTVPGFEGFSPVISLAIGGDTMKGVPDNSNPTLSLVPHMLVDIVQLWDSSKPADSAAEICDLVSKLTPTASTQSSTVQTLLALLSTQCSSPGGGLGLGGGGVGGGGLGGGSVSGDFGKLTTMMTPFYTSNFTDMTAVTADWSLANEWAGGGNAEKQAYLPGQASVSGGALVLTAEAMTAEEGEKYPIKYINKFKTVSTYPARVKTAKLQLNKGVQFGAVSFDIDMDVAGRDGAWPAAWMLPQYHGVDPKKTDPQKLSVEPTVAFGTDSLWPACGEIDLMEAKGNDNTKIVQTLHFGKTYDPNWKYIGTTRTGDFITTGRHTYSAAWSSDGVAFFVDGSLTAYRSWATSGDLGGEPNPFLDKTWCPILNIAMGGNFFTADGSQYLDPSTDTWIGKPAKMKVYSVKMWSTLSSTNIKSLVSGLSPNASGSPEYGGKSTWTPFASI